MEYACLALFSGIAAGLVVGKGTKYCTSPRYRHVKSIARQSGTGSATNILIKLMEIVAIVFARCSLGRLEAEDGPEERWNTAGSSG